MLFKASTRLLMVAAITMVAFTACNPMTLTPYSDQRFVAEYVGPYGPNGPWLEVQVPELSPEDNMEVTAWLAEQSWWDTFDVTSNDYHVSELMPLNGVSIYVFLKCEDESGNEVPCRTRPIIRMRVVNENGPVGDLIEWQGTAAPWGLQGLRMDQPPRPQHPSSGHDR
jgi:hypothetical protein